MGLSRRMLNVGTAAVIVLVSAMLYGISRGSASISREEWKQKSASSNPEDQAAVSKEDYPQSVGVAAVWGALFGMAVIVVDLIRRLF
jgi:hypothetical protein